jgi:hypothetical protein
VARAATYLVAVIPPVLDNLFMEGVKVDLLSSDVQQLSVKLQPLDRTEVFERPIKPSLI